MSPVIDSIAGQFAGRVKVGKVNVAENFDLAAEYNINAIPRVLIFRGDTRPLHQVVGLTTEAELAKLINNVLQA